MKFRRVTTVLAIALVAGLGIVALTAQTATRPAARIRTSDLQRWLTYLASDDLEGRGNMSEGLGLAAAYIADELKAMGVKPGGDNRTYFEHVKVLGVNSTNRSTVTVEVRGQSRTFKDGEAITFPKNVGGRRTITFEQVEFMGYGLNAPSASHNDYAGRDVRGKAVVWLGPTGPKVPDPQQARRLLAGRNRYATEQAMAGAVIGPEVPRLARPPQAGAADALPGAPAAGPPAGGPPVGARPGGPGGQQIPSDFTTVQRLDNPIPPAVTVKVDGGDAFWEFLFSAADVKYAELKDKASKQEPLPTFALGGVKLTFNLDADYTVVQTQLTRNVVAVIEGSDPRLKDTWVAFGAHYDHNGYQQGQPVARPGAPAPPADDRIFNGADDDGSGSVALMAIARAFGAGPRPKRSLVFVWFAGEERGLWGSRFHADYGLPPEKVAAQLNADMIGRNRENKPEEIDTVYIIGSDRISTELHNINVDANAGLARPLKLDYEFNDPADPNSFYFRSDHYSYAAKGIPVIFFTAGEHPDYHRVTDSVEKIQFDKLTRITELIYETGRRVANLDHLPVRDNKGPRAGKGSTGKLTQ
jgi:hypothetical protein